MATAFLFCGLPASGKSTLARRLERETGAVRYTLDEIMIARYDYTIFDDAYGAAAAREKKRIWREARALLDAGRDVILDWSLWNRQRRRTWVRKITATGHKYVLYYLDVPLENVKERLRRRNAHSAADRVHQIPLWEVERFATQLFEPPAADEGLIIEVVSG